MWFCVCKMMKCYLKTPTMQRAPLKRSINRGWVWVQPGGESVTPPFWPPVSAAGGLTTSKLKAVEEARSTASSIPSSRYQHILLPISRLHPDTPGAGFFSGLGMKLPWSPKSHLALSSPRIGPESKSTPGRGIVLCGRSAWSWWVVMFSPCPIWTHGKH